jgi:hypothetical protein
MAPPDVGPGERPLVVVDDVKDIGMSLYRVRVTGPDRVTRYVLIPKSKATFTFVQISAAAVGHLWALGVLSS